MRATLKKTVATFVLASTSILFASTAAADLIDNFGADVTLRLRASDLVQGDGTAVTSWGGLTQGQTTKQPLFVLSDPQFNGESAVDFDGVTNHTNGDALIGTGLNVDSRTIFAVVNAESGGGLRGSVSNGGDNHNLRLENATQYRSPGNGENSADYSSGGGQFYIDGDLVSGTSGGSYTANTPHVVTAIASANRNYPNFVLGNGSPANSGSNAFDGRYWDGQIAEVVVFDRILDGNEEFEVLRHLRSTYGLSSGAPLVRGTGAGALFGNDLTDPENDGDDTVAGGANFNATFTATTEAGFDPGDGFSQGAFDVFDNNVGTGPGKICCGGVSTGSPFQVTAEFSDPVDFTGFTITSGGDAAWRRPTDWKIQGSRDGVTFFDLFVQSNPTSLWTANSQVLAFQAGLEFSDPAGFYRYLRLEVTDTQGGSGRTPGQEFQLDELEFFGTIVPEPGTFLLLVIGSGMLAMTRRRRQVRQRG